MNDIFWKLPRKSNPLSLVGTTTQKKEERRLEYRLITHFVVFALLTILMGKYWFADSASLFLYSYGIVVTLVILTTFFFAFVLYKDPYELAIRNLEAFRPEPLVSCMVAVKDEEDVIERCILSFINQTYKNRKIIFVNDGSADGTGKILDEYSRGGAIQVIHLAKNVGKKKALSEAMRIARGSIFVFSDSDSVIAADAIEKIVAIFNVFPEIGAVSGHCRAMNGNKNLLTRVQDSWYEGQFSIRKAFESVFGAVTCVSGPLAVFRREAVYNFIPAWENDTFLGQEFKFATDRTLTGFVLGSKAIGGRLKKKYADSPFVKDCDYPLNDWKIVYCKAAKAWTNVPDTFSKVIKQQARWKKSFIRNMFFTGAFYWRKPLIPALNYYLHILFVLAGPFITFRHLIYLPLRGNLNAAILYIAGIVFIGFMFGLAYKLENRDCHKWMYRPLMSLLSTLILSWLIFYSALTIKKMIWYRG